MRVLNKNWCGGKMKKIAAILKFSLILVLITAWIFSGWPPIWQNPTIPLFVA